MCGAKWDFRKFALPLLFIFVVMSNNVVQADAPVSPPPAGTAVQIQTYGVLPVMLMNLTQSAINMNVSTNQAYAYAKANTPIAIGLSGVAYAQGGGTTPFFSNPTTPAITPSGAANASLQPVVLSSGSASNTNFSFVNAFALFPSWSGTVSFPNTAYTTYQSPGGASMGATPGPSNTSHSTTPQQQAFGQSMANPSTSSINLKLVSGTGATLPGYAININSLGGATSAYQSQQSTFPPKQDWVEDILTLLIDIDTVLEPNPLTVIDMVYGIYTSVKEMFDSGSEVYTNAPYPATYKGINVTAALSANGGGLALPMQSGNSSYLVYNTTAANSATTLPLEQQNSLIVYTWRTSPLNTSSPERNAADTLVVVLVNNGVYAAAQMQTCLNSPSNALGSTAKRQYKPRREESQDTFKLLEIITAISKKNPQDAQKLLDLFGMNGQYGKEKHDSNALTGIRMKAKEIFEKHKAEIPAIHSYLAKLAH